ncbi:hypothetical protein FRC15_005212 [Serendipita sp. 397]|nr:hypothetical protein FRC15_005212 [Serendipita sp. 397]
MIRAANSAFYNLDDTVARSVAKNIDGSYDIATLNGVSNVNGGSNTVNNSSATRVDNSRRNAIIGVSVVFGLVALAVLVWWIMKTYKARQEGMHKRLSYDNNVNYGAAGTGVAVDYERNYGFGANAEAPRADSPPNLHNPFMTEREREEEARGIRRNSFYAIGPDDASIEEETFDYMSQRSSNGGLNRATSSGGHGNWLTVGGGSGANNNGAGRRPVVGQPISQPILRESSMGNW